jgi:signal transduction histidine kinase/ActR/RegA family two-component response regulator
MMHGIRQSISRKMLLLVLSTTFMALLVYAVAMLIYDVRNYRALWISDLTTQADILGRFAAPALEFNDPQGARENLEQLRARPKILAAAVYTATGTVFATYRHEAAGERTEAEAFPPLQAGERHIVSGDTVAIFRPIRQNGETVGAIYLRAKYELSARMSSYLGILVAVMACSLLVAALISVWLQAAITRPILAVTDIARRVIRDRDFSFRATRSTDDEIGVLVDAFNDMLGEVGQRAEALKESNEALLTEMHERRSAEEALRQLNDTLEQRIAARTAELEIANEQLRQSQKMEAVGQLTGGIAHDFNNLLAGIIGNIEMLQIRIAQGRIDGLERYTRSAMSSADRASALIHRLLAFSRRQTLAPKPTDINRLVGSMLDLIQHSAGPTIQVDTGLYEGLWDTMCDPNQLENALLNLAINARDAMPAGGKLIIETGNVVLADPTAPAHAGKVDRDYVTVSVADTGTGMTPEVLARAVDPFYTTKPLGQGTGLGLSMVYGFVNQSGGYMRINSQPGSGTTVRLHLPRYYGQAAASVVAKQTMAVPRAASRATVLLVDDEAPVRELAKEVLEDLGYTVFVAADGQIAMQALRSAARIDLLVTDVGLPNGMNGRQLAEAARVLRPRLRVLFITGYAQAAAMWNEQMQAGMDILTKPFRLDAFATKVSAMLDPSMAVPDDT